MGGLESKSILQKKLFVPFEKNENISRERVIVFKVNVMPWKTVMLKLCF